jgi:hypothetical protein
MDKNIVFIFVLLENLTYYGQRDDDSLNASFADKKGKFHVEGRLVLATKMLLHQHVKELAKTLVYCGSHQKYLTACPRATFWIGVVTTTSTSRIWTTKTTSPT